MKDKRKDSDAWWLNLYQDNNFINRWQLSLLCEKIGAQAGWQVDKMLNLKLYTG